MLVLVLNSKVSQVSKIKVKHTLFIEMSKDSRCYSDYKVIY